MSVRILLDNNFFDKYVMLSQRDRDRILSGFKSRKLAFYPTFELISELLGLYRTKRSDSLRIYIPFFLEISGNRVLNPSNRIVQSELGIGSDGIFLNACAVDRLKIKLKEISCRGENHSETIALIKDIALQKEEDVTNSLLKNPFCESL